jgi:hypothetical protein
MLLVPTARPGFSRNNLSRSRYGFGTLSKEQMVAALVAPLSNYDGDVAQWERAKQALMSLDEANLAYRYAWLPGAPGTTSVPTVTGGLTTYGGPTSSAEAVQRLNAQPIPAPAPYVPTAPAPAPAATAPAPPVAALTPVPQTQFSLNNLSRGGAGAFQVGDQFEVKISGSAPNSPVLITGLQGARQLHSAAGNTDAHGNFTLVGVIAADSVGPWMQVWSVGGQQIGTAQFLVTGPPATPQVSAPPSVAPPPPGPPTVVKPVFASTAPAATPVVASGVGFDFTLPALFSGSVEVFGFDVPYWALGAGALGLFIFSGSGRRF